ncbi:Bro-N domain-containing protein [Kitasatospora purpeofusca]|uniref:BRO-N domain-containing protein n=1 Tax=Kitasatospora purpeofusca TaxID=67352 RepID=UPI00225782A8|nr:Bro-N domain-containing protein [Kitasatospora purpeofusca]MCX4686855.1 Bro-N domain-containing protein [Kitasatospora purpeofusca]
MDDEQTMQGRMELVRSSFPVTGQPIRVVMIDGEPWFVTADVCRVLGRGNPTDAAKVLEPHQHRTVDLRSVTLVRNKGCDVSADQKAYRRGNPILGVVSEAGLYGLLMRSDKQSARPFRDWVTEELLPSIRRGDTDIPTQQRRMAETLTEAIGQQVYVVARIEHEDWPELTVHSDGTVHCRHGEMRLRLPGQDDSGPPFGPYFECPGGEHVGIRGSRVVPGCPKLRIVDLVRMRDEARSEAEAGAAPEHALMYAVVDRGRIDRLHGTPRQFAEFMREYRG